MIVTDEMVKSALNSSPLFETYSCPDKVRVALLSPVSMVGENAVGAVRRRVSTEDRGRHDRGG